MQPILVKMTKVPEAWRSAAAVLACALLTVPARALPAQDDGGRLVVYLDIAAGTAQDVELVLGKAELAGEKDTLALAGLPISMVASKGPGRQILLWEQAVPAGHYGSLTLRIDRISAYAQAAPIRPSPPPGGIVLPIDLTAISGQPAPLFLFWNPASDVLSQKVYTPALKSGQEDRLPPASLAIVANAGSDYLTCIDRFRHRVVSLIASGRQPVDMVYASLRAEFYVANSASDDISVINLATGKVERSLSLRAGDGPTRIALSPDQQRLYVLNAGSRCVSVLNLLSHQEEGRIDLESTPAALAVDARNGAVYVTGRDSDQLSALDPLSLTIAPLLNLGAGSAEIILNQRERRLYVEKAAQRQLTLIDLSRNTVAGNIRLCSPAGGFAFHPATRTLFASLPGCGLISIMKPDDNLEIGTLPLPHAPGRIGLDPESKSLVVLFPAEGKVAFYNANSWNLQATLDVGKQPLAVAFAQ
jgi:YVTN family beta-propeller protein